MNAISKWAAALALLSGAVYGQVPSTNDTSDASANTGMGYDALSGNGVVNSPCAVGEPSLASSRCFNTAVGNDALALDTDGGNYNTGVGSFVLYQNTTGFYNTASGAGALEQNTTGNDNTAFGFGALSSNILGDNNTRTTGSYNTASGSRSLYMNTTGNYNDASGQAALYSNTSGSGNEASGHAALYANTTGSYNVGVGYGAGFDQTTGSYNVAVGYIAGYDQTTGSNNIYISHRGVAGESGVTRIGTPNAQTETYIAGIENTKITGSAVYVTSSGQLGVLASSERYKTDVHSMTGTEKLGDLRPVTFHLKTDPHRDLQYGLIAEEVARVYPELVTRDERGVIQGVRYEELTPMLLNEVKRQQGEIAALMKMNLATQAAVAKLQSQLHP